MASQMEQYQEAAKRLGWIAAWREMHRFAQSLVDRSGRYEDTRAAKEMLDLCTSQLFMSGEPGVPAPSKLSPEITTLGGDPMTLQVSMSAHADTAEAEDQMLDKLRSAAKAMAESGELYSASANTSHHGTVDLKADVADTADDPGGSAFR